MAELVAGMQHTLTTFRRIVRTPKKAADARVFCFQHPRSAFQIARKPRKNGLAVRLLTPGASGNPAGSWKVMGISNEENGLGGNGAGNDFRFGSCGGFAGKSTATGAL